ncbi:MAG TPA: MMPL family transporter [Chloroflexia bacterium]|nr:MMPL family transporter [Chloroflexia bacterium]
MFGALGRFIYKNRWLALIAGLVLIVAGVVYGTSVFGRLKNGGFYDPNAESTQVMTSIHENLGQDESALIVLFTSKDMKVEDPKYKEEVEATLAQAKGLEGTGNVTTYYTTGAKQFVSLDGKSTYAVIGFQGSEEEQSKIMDVIRDPEKPLLTSDVLDVKLGGLPAFSQEISKQVEKDLAKAESLTFPILAVLLVLIFGSLIAAALPLAIGGVVILGAFLILRIASDFSDISIFSINVITMLGLGLAIDYSLFMVSRFREELVRQEGDVYGSLIKTMQTAGRTVMFSGLTVAISLLSLLVFPQMFLQSMGLGGAAAVVVAMLAALTVLPAALALLGHRVNSASVWSLLRRGRKREAIAEAVPEGHGFWFRWSNFVMRRAGIMLIVALIPLVIAGLPFLRAKMSVADTRSMPASSQSRYVGERLENDFPRNETTPIEIVYRAETRPDYKESVGDLYESLMSQGTLEKYMPPVASKESLSALYDYTRAIEKIPGVTRVESMVNYGTGMSKQEYLDLFAENRRLNDGLALGLIEQYAKGNYTLVKVLYTPDAASEETKQIVKDIRGLSLPAGMSAQVGGIPAIVLDFLGSLAKGVPLALALIVGIIFILLFLMLGSVVVPLKAVILNILSLSVSFGALVWIFQDGNLSNLLGFTSIGSIDGTQPVLIFAIAFGLSMDYEVFLLSRIKENYDRTGDNTASVALGVQKTGYIITSAAALLVIVFAGFATGEISQIKQVGIGLSLAVLVDATLVRMLLVPATMKLMGNYNWWAPRPLKRLYERMGMSEVEHAAEETPQPALEAEVPDAHKPVVAQQTGS